MRNIIIFVILISIVILVVVPFFIIKPTLEPVKFSSIHPNIIVTKSESILFTIYSNYKLKIKTNQMWGANPKIIGIIYTDKIRPNNQVMNDDREADFGSLINITEQDEALIYIYVSKNIIDSDIAKNRIEKYTISTIKYFQQKNNLENDTVSKLIKLPIDVKKD